MTDTSPLRVALLIYGSIDTVSGGYLYNRQLVRYLRSRGDSVEIISLPYRGYWRHLGDNVSRALRRRLAALDVDILIQDEMNHPSLAWLNGWVPRRFPIVSLVHLLKVTERHSWGVRPIFHPIEHRYLRSVDGYIVTSQTTATEIETRFNLHKPTVIAVPAGDRFQPQNNPSANRTPDTPLQLLYVGNVIRRKGLHVVLEAMVEATETELIVIGPTDVEAAYTKELVAFIGRNALQSRVHFVGALDHQPLVEQYQMADVFVMPAYYESFGIVYLEAMGFGLPTIGTTGGAAHELITHGENGFLIAPDDAQSLAKYLKTLHNHPTLRQQMRDRALARFAAHPSWNNSMATVRDFLLAMQLDWETSR